MRMMPLDEKTCGYSSCCGKMICSGCFDSLTRNCCPFCNAPTPTTDDDCKKRLHDRIEKYNDPEALTILGYQFESGDSGFPVDYTKAAELYKRASELGSASGHFHIGTLYIFGRGVDKDTKKGTHHYQTAAMMGHPLARHNLGAIELENGNLDRAMSHFMIAATCGYDKSLENLKLGFKKGLVTKEDLEKTLRCYQASQDEMRSEDRDRANAARGYPKNDHVQMLHML